MTKIKSNELYIAPPTLLIVHFLLFHFIPPLFGGRGYLMEQMILNFISIIIFSVTFHFLNIFFYRDAKRYDNRETYYDFKIVFIIYIGSIIFRIYEFNTFGLLAFTVGGRAQLGYWTAMRIVIWPIFLVWIFYEIKKGRKIGYFFLIIELIYALSTFSKQSLMMFMLAYLLINLILFPQKIYITRYLTTIIISIFVVFFLGSILMGLRVMIYKGADIGDIVESKFELTYNVLEYIRGRLNLHDVSHALYPRLNIISYYDLMALKSIFLKLSGIMDYYIVHPSSVAPLIGIRCGLITDTFTSIGIPTNLTVFASFGYLGVILFYICLAIFYYLIWSLRRWDRVVFSMIYIVWAYDLLSSGSVFSYVIFSTIFNIVTLCLFLVFPLITFRFIKKLFRTRCSYDKNV